MSLNRGTRLGAKAHRSAGTGCRHGRPSRGPLRGLPRGRAPARREGGHRAADRPARPITGAGALDGVDRRRAVGGGRLHRLARGRHGAPRSGGVPGGRGRHARERHAAAQDRGAGGRDRSRRRRPDRRDPCAGSAGRQMRPRRLVRRGSQTAGSRPAVFRAQRRLPARLFRPRRGRPHRLDRSRRPDRRGADDRGRGRHADRDPRRARDRAPDDPAPSAPARRSPAARSGVPRGRSPRADASAPRGPTRPVACAYSTRRRRSRSRPRHCTAGAPTAEASACEARQPGWEPAPRCPGTIAAQVI